MRVAAVGLCALMFGAVVLPQAVSGQTPGQLSQPQAPPAPAQGGGGRGGRGGNVPQGPPRQTAPVDLTGTWVSVVTEDWMWRMRTPPKGDVTSVPLNPEGRKVAESWDPSQDGRCEAYGVGGLMRMPMRMKISWENDTTLKIETDAGQQTRLLRFAQPGQAPVLTAAAPAQRTLQGESRAEWIRSGGAFDAFMERSASSAAPGQRWGQLQVVTRNMLPGWLRRNGVPYSENATVTERFIRLAPPNAGDWLVVSTIVEDPRYLAQPFITSSNFKKEPDDSKFKPAPCRAS